MKTDRASKKPSPAPRLSRAVVSVEGASVALAMREGVVVDVDLLPLGGRHRDGGDLWDLELAKAAIQVREYLQGRRKTFTLKHSQPGTPFQKEVWTALRRVPYGRTVTYGELAGLAGRPRAARPVGSALNRNRLPLLVPCHRVKAGGGLGGFGCGIAWKKRLLALEGSL